MAVVHYLELKCPACKRTFETRWLHLSSGLGPARFECAKCHRVFDSDRVEWDLMRTAGRVRHLAWTGLYVLVIGYFGGLAARATVHFNENGPWKDKMPDLFGTGFLVGAVGWGLLVIGVQIHRVLESRKRTASERPAPGPTGFWSVHCQLQFKFLAGPVLFGLLGWAVAYLRSVAR